MFYRIMFVTLYFVILIVLEEVHFRLATGKSSHWWMCNGRLVKKDKILNSYDYIPNLSKKGFFHKLEWKWYAFKFKRGWVKGGYDSITYYPTGDKGSPINDEVVIKNYKDYVE